MAAAACAGEAGEQGGGFEGGGGGWGGEGGRAEARPMGGGGGHASAAFLRVCTRTLYTRLHTYTSTHARDGESSCLRPVLLLLLPPTTAAAAQWGQRHRQLRSTAEGRREGGGGLGDGGWGLACACATHSHVVANVFAEVSNSNLKRARTATPGKKCPKEESETSHCSRNKIPANVGPNLGTCRRFRRQIHAPSSDSRNSLKNQTKDSDSLV